MRVSERAALERLRNFSNWPDGLDPLATEAAQGGRLREAVTAAAALVSPNLGHARVSISAGDAPVGHDSNPPTVSASFYEHLRRCLLVALGRPLELLAD